jgi:uncharacterized membrane protein SpoIIM required for sporulation
MNLNRFEREREAVWRALESDLERCGGRPERLGARGALDFGRRYREAAADLALARVRFAGDPVVERLERLVFAARQAVYSERSGRAGSLTRFVSRDYWRMIFERPGALAAAAAATFVPCLLAALWAHHDPVAALGLVPAQFRGAATPHVHRIAAGATTEAVLASSIFVNNIGVSFLAFAGGLLFGAGTLLVLAYNGLLLGTLAGVTLRSGTFAVFVRYVVPHGVLELSCFTVAGAAGLRLGWALIDPGTSRRADQLRAAARPAVAMVLGTAPYLVVAGLTEGFVTPRGLPLGAALAVGLTLGGAYWTVALIRGRTGQAKARARDQIRIRALVSK